VSGSGRPPLSPPEATQAAAVVVHLPRSLVALFPGLPRHAEVDGAAVSVDAVLRALDGRAPGLRDRLVEAGPRLRRHINVFVDGQPATLETAVCPGAVVHVVPAVSGGATDDAAPADPDTGLAERRAWLAERRAATIAVYDAEAPGYEADPYPIDVQRRWVDRLIALVPPGGVILDAPCGTGVHFAAVVAAGRRVIGIDQSPGMLAQARAKGLAERLELVGLQELAETAAADAAMTVDAMENVPPEDWPVVLSNLRRAVRPGAPLYLTVEEMADAEIDAAHAALLASGAPAVRGEVVEGDVAGYHYYPGRARVLAWLAETGLAIVDEASEQHPGWGYRHFLLRAP
jgi:SAM-dependent methyltransferase/molybdopterin converting factor small subunit